MDHRKMAPSPVRARRIAMLLVPVLAVAAVAGCGHRRMSMRPVYGTPVQGTVVTPSCPTGTVTTQPDSSEPFLAPNAAAPSSVNSEPVIRAGGSPPVPDSADEPGLNVPAKSLNSTPTNPGVGGIELTRPSALKSTGRKASIPRRSPRVSLREEVRPYFSDADDAFQPPKADRPWKYVVVHHSASATGGYDQIDRDHRKVLGFEGCGYHFVIGNGTDSPDGQIEVAERWLNQKNGVHCRNGRTPDVNEYGIGICLVGNFDQSPPTPRQVAAAKALVAYLGDRYQIPSDRIGSHDQFADGPTACPGKDFPSDAIFGSKHIAAR